MHVNARGDGIFVTEAKNGGMFLNIFTLSQNTVFYFRDKYPQHFQH